jgi:hypothetical protein
VRVHRRVKGHYPLDPKLGTQGVEMASPLRSASKDADRGGVRPRQVLRRQRRRRRGSLRRHPPRVENGRRPSGFRVIDDDYSADLRGASIPVARERPDPLHPRRAAARNVSGHRVEERVSLGMDAKLGGRLHPSCGLLGEQGGELRDDLGV